MYLKYLDKSQDLTDLIRYGRSSIAESGSNQRSSFFTFLLSQYDQQIPYQNPSLTTQTSPIPSYIVN